MKLRKSIAAIAAAAVTATAVAASASASLVVVEGGDAGLSSGTGMWMVQLFNVGSVEENKPATDYGIDYASVAKISIVVKAIDPDFQDGGIGGSIVWSQNGGDIVQGPLWDKYNWPSNEYWGYVDEALEIDTLDSAKPVQAYKIADYTYQLDLDVSGMNAMANGDAASIGCMQAGIQYWGNDMSDYEVEGFMAYDKSGTKLLEFDGKGVCTYTAGGTASAAPAAGDVAAATDSSKGSPDTGIADVAAIAGIAVLAGGAFIVAKKRK